MRQLAYVFACIVLTHSGCSLRATTDQILDTTSNVTGTTSSARSWFTDGGVLKPDFKTTAFVVLNHVNLSQDLAAGSGEYLTSVSALLGVPGDRRPAFFSRAQAHYADALGGTPSQPNLVVLLQDAAQPFVDASPRPADPGVSRP